jgi:hypothetical protein
VSRSFRTTGPAPRSTEAGTGSTPSR